MVLWKRSHCGPIGPAGWRDHVVVLCSPRDGEITLWSYVGWGDEVVALFASRNLDKCGSCNCKKLHHS